MQHLIHLKKLLYRNDLSIVENYYFSMSNFVHLNSIRWSCELVSFGFNYVLAYRFTVFMFKSVL